MAKNNERTLISVKKSTRGKLKKFGIMGDTYDDVIQKLIISWDKHHKYRHMR